MLGIMFFIVGFILGIPIAHYTTFLINNSEDCQKKIEFSMLSIRSMLIAFVGGVLWLVIYLVRDISVLTIIYAVASSILLAISVVDFAVYEIPPQFNVALAVLGLVCIAVDWQHWLQYVIGAFTVSGIFYLMALATGGKGMGGGDIKLMAATGLMLGWKKILFVMLIGAVLGIFIHSIAMIILKKKSMLAFGPYLSMAVYIMMIYGNELVQWYVDTFLTFY